MKRFAVVSLLTLFLSTLAPGQTHAPSGAQQPPAGWINYSSNAGRFSVLMPAQPQAEERPVTLSTGKLINYVFIAQKNGVAFAISYVDYPPNNQADPQQVLNNVRQGTINGLKGTLISGKEIMHKGYPGREYHAAIQDRTYSSRIFLVNSRLYQMAVVAPNNQANAADINRFLTSFDLKLDEK